MPTQVEIPAPSTAMIERSSSFESRMARRGGFTFHSNIQEDLPIPAILCYLQPSTTSSFDEKRQLIAAVMEAREKIAKKFAVVSRKLTYSFIYCMPKHHSSMDRMPNEFVAKTIFKLAVLFDVYDRYMAGDVDEKVESYFRNIMAAVAEAKRAARRHRAEVSFARRVMSMIDSLLVEALTTSQPLNTSNDSHSINCESSAEANKRRKKGLTRYRALVGLGDAGVSKKQLVQIVSDLMRTNPGISLAQVSSALDDVLGIN
ncbi:expressed unknown protein [Seminavis robusta]|uniref:Uncharacterized protein n=1 Tax=Seminavis robusta TaxID=568900 RepID=A0A9N8EEE2_9STRA|nr:expressed unknown protein [Seminavis robusta]|eukprot:Sro969_g226230.1 n/a (259) ;mRNA; f:25159-25935